MATTHPEPGEYITTTIRSHGRLPVGVEVVVYPPSEGDLERHSRLVKWIDAGTTLEVPAYCITND